MDVLFVALFVYGFAFIFACCTLRSISYYESRHEGTTGESGRLLQCGKPFAAIWVKPSGPARPEFEGIKGATTNPRTAYDQVSRGRLWWTFGGFLMDLWFPFGALLAHIDILFPRCFFALISDCCLLHFICPAPVYHWKQMVWSVFAFSKKNIFLENQFL